MLIDWLQSFVVMFVVDILYVVYTNDVNKHKPLRASLWATCLFLLTSLAIVNYTKDYLNVIPACIGAFMGTYVGMLIKKN